ncbi:hypothetical protein [Rhizosphaericola mali]|uniref:Uncharacterized protein n=1 Tax=Rhizosphaericola mali TaxID=2545455 RepID=A0A5P2G7T5_9BACT|nr:hypothetical protein [Rhizosphaericola mali]QES89830.1 hypothetical protein E0W69_014560 [Rhizosphaericola mali]
MKYRMEFELMVDQILSINSVDELRFLQLEFDELYHKVTVHCKEENMDDEFRNAYTLIIDKMIELYGREIESIDYPAVHYRGKLFETEHYVLN